MKPVMLHRYLMIILACSLNKLLSILGASDRLETSRPAHMRPRPELHETETETETESVLEATMVSRT